MPRAASFIRISALAVLAAGSSGCQRGCGTEWVRARKKSVTEVPASFGRAIDCPDGLARCVGGVVEESKLARIALPCSTTESKENCTCPWEALTECPRGCAVEGASVVVAADRAAARLCAPDPNKPVARPAPAAVAPPGACAAAAEAGGYRCTASLVLACAPTDPETDAAPPVARVVSACLRGCAHEGETLEGDDGDADGVARILCAP